MAVIIWILFFICLCVGIYNSSSVGDIIMGWLIGVLFTLGICTLQERTTQNDPTPMEVYQGKTILEYKVVVDSTVVWKEEIKLK